MQIKQFTLALIQMQLKGGKKDWNIHHAIELITEAAYNGAQVALLPECLDLGWLHSTSLSMAERIPEGFPSQCLINVAQANSIYVCAGLTEKSEGQVYNSAVIIDKCGEILCKHRKLNELDIGQKFYAQGDRLNIARTEFGMFGLMICADAFAKDRVLSRSLCYMGADVILSPNTWAVDSDHDNIIKPYGETWRNSYIPVAREFSTAIFGVSNVGWITDGPWKGKKCIGCSLGIDPSGKEIVQGPYGVDAETIIYVDVEPVERPTRGTGWSAFR